jgi:hypothetical protein
MAFLTSNCLLVVVDWSGVVDRGRCMVSRSRMRSRGMVCRGSMRSGSMVCWSGMGSRVCLVVGLTGVRDISNVARVSISNVVSHGLETTVGKLDVVGAAGGISVTLLSLSVVGAGIVIMDAILVGVVSGHLLVVSGLMVGRLGVVRGSGVGVGMGSLVSEGHGGEEGNSDESLK